MSQTTVVVLTDDLEMNERVKNSLLHLGVNFKAFNRQQWIEGIQTKGFLTQLLESGFQLAAGLETIEKNMNIIPFPNSSNGNSSPSTGQSGYGSLGSMGGSMGTLGAVEREAVATMDEVELKAIEKAIYQCNGNFSKAAKALGIGRATLYRKVKYFNIDTNLSRRRKAA
jgi:Bacterial regulatory protein, Fis family